MHGLERKLHARDLDLRTTGPFEWGLKYLDPPVASSSASALANSDKSAVLSHPRDEVDRFNEKVLGASDHFFTPPSASSSDFDFDGYWLRFPSAVVTPYPDNNLVYGRYFAAGDEKRVVIIAPHWNAKEDAYLALCHALNRFGISALRLSLPYHDRRMPQGLTRAEYMVSANIGRTIQAVQQSVQDIRRATDWLWNRGARHIGLTGTSIGSCVAWLAFTHDARFTTGAFNLVSSFFGDVVWRGLTTSHIRSKLEPELNQDEVRRVWLAISPSAYIQRVQGDTRQVLMVSAKYDLTFLPDLTAALLDDCERHDFKVNKAFLSCGHYTIGRSPFKYLDGWYLVNFFRKRLGCSVP